MVSPYLPPVTIDCVIDVSHWQGRVDFATVHREGVRAVFIKASQGVDSHDPMYRENESNAEAAGVLTAPYHFVTDDDPLDQFHNLAAVVDLKPGMVVMLDWEPNGTSASPDTVARLGEAVEKVTGRPPLLYTGRYQLDQPHPVLSTWPLMLAEYGDKPICPPGWNTWLFHQYTNVGQVHGIHGNVDRSVFAGTEEELIDWWHDVAASVVAQLSPDMPQDEPTAADEPPKDEPKDELVHELAVVEAETADAETHIAHIEHELNISNE